MRIELIIVFFSMALACLDAAVIRVPKDHKSIQEAINAAAPGDRIEVAPGVYNESITLKKEVTLRSVGNDERASRGLVRAEKTIIDGKDLGNVSGITMAEGAILDGFTITRFGKYDSEEWERHWTERGENQSYEHIWKFGAPAIAIVGVSCQVENNIVSHNGDTGIGNIGADGLTSFPLIINNTCFRNMGGGIGSMKGAGGIISKNKCFENFYAGIGHNGASPIVENNICYNNVRAGIGISNAASPIVKKNHCYKNRRAGIGIRSGEETKPLIEQNECNENGMAGIGVEKKAAPTIRNNNCHSNVMAGIGSRGGSSPLISGNHCHKNKAAGIGINSATPKIIDNLSEKNHLAGIGISGNSDAYVFKNRLIENRLVAIGVPDGAKAHVQDNIMIRSGGMPPMVAVLGKSEVILMSNSIQGGGVAGILLDGKLTAIGNKIKGNNRGSGIAARKDSHLKIGDNEISNYQKEINDSGATIISIDAPNDVEE